MAGQFLVPMITGEWTELLDVLHVGDQIFRRETLRDEDGILTNSTVTGTIQRVGSTAVNLTVAQESTGVYLVTFPVFSAAGIHNWRIAAAGAVNRVERGRVRVQA
jgi:hypothetical protein